MTLLCSNCEALLEAGNVYCLNCGQAISASLGECETVIKPTKAAAPKKKKVAVVAWVAFITFASVAAVLAGLVIIVAVSLLDNMRTTATQNETKPNNNLAAADPPKPRKTQTSDEPTPEPKPIPQPVTIDVAMNNIDGARWITFTVPSSGGRVTGKIMASGVWGNDLNVYLMTEEQHTDYINKATVFPAFSSIKKTATNVNKRLGPGTYYLVCESPSKLTTRNASGQLTMQPL